MSRPRDIPRGTRERPLEQVVARARCDFEPEHPGRAPWHKPTLRRVEIAITDNRAVVNLAVADRERLHGLNRPSYERDWLEPYDWMPVGWGVGRSSADFR
jgi:hypothetical protein